jgi:hypothetical protein
VTDPTLSEVLAEMRTRAVELADDSNGRCDDAEQIHSWTAALEKYGPLVKAAEAYHKCPVGAGQGVSVDMHVAQYNLLREALALFAKEERCG